MTEQEHLHTWEGTMSVAELDTLLVHVGPAVVVGERAGDFALGRTLNGGAAAWPAGRCFTEDFEIRWWSVEGDDETRCITILNRLPVGWCTPQTLRPAPHPLCRAPEEVRYLCVGQYERRGRDGVHLWWEARYGRAFEYLASAPPALEGKTTSMSANHRGRVFLRAVIYELVDGRTQHRLVRFEHGGPEEGAT